MCYLASALARRGHQVFFITHTTEPAVVDDVDCMNARRFEGECLRGADAIVVLNDANPEIAMAIRSAGAVRQPLILWTQHDVNMPGMAALATAEGRNVWDAIVLVSEWQQRRYSEAYGLAPEQQDVLRNAIAPAVARL